MKEKILGITKSYCPICLETLKATISLRRNKVFISKICKLHGKFKCLHIWDTVELYEAVKKIHSISSNDPNGILIDLTSRCNLKCPICFVEGGKDKKSKELTTADMIAQIQTLQEGANFPAIFFFGGEPTLRKNLPHIIKKVKALKLMTYLFTNGLKLKDRRYVRKLKKYGLDHVVIQFDSLNDNNYVLIRGAKILQSKLKAIENLKKEKIYVDLFALILKGINENEIAQIISYASKNSLVIKNVYISTLTREGRYPTDLTPTTNSERLELMERQTVLRRRDFFVCTEFDHYLSLFIRRLFGSCQRLSSCDLGCYIYSLSSGKYVPLTWIVKLENITLMLKEIVKYFNSGRTYNVLKLFKLARIIFNLRHITRYYGLFLNLFIFFLFSFFSSFFYFHMENKIKNLFRVVITQFQDRYNADFDLFKNCNLWSQVDDTLQPLCVKIIKSAGAKQVFKL